MIDREKLDQMTDEEIDALIAEERRKGEAYAAHAAEIRDYVRLRAEQGEGDGE